MGEQCPIAGFTVNARAARVNAFLTVLLLLVFLLTSLKWLIFVLCADFLLRCCGRGKYSFFSSISRSILSAVRIEPLFEDAGPKVFAAKIGLIFCMLVSVFYLADLMLLANIFALVFLFCAALEAFFGFCLGCKMYSLVNRAK